MRLNTNNCLEWISKTGNIIPLIDTELLRGIYKDKDKEFSLPIMGKWEWDISSPSVPQPFIDLPDVIVYRLLDSKDTTLHLGTVGLALFADKDIRPWYEVLAYYQICPYRFMSAMRYASRLGIKRSLRSKPWLGRAYKLQSKKYTSSM